MLVRYIIRVRRAEPAVRTRHAFFWAVGITTFAAVIWVLTLPSILEPLPEGGMLGEAAPDTPRPWESFFNRAKEQLAAVGGANAPLTDTSTDTPAIENPPPAQMIELSPEDIAAARARAAIDYQPAPATTATATSTTGAAVAASTTLTQSPQQPRVVRIATTSSAVGATTSTSTIR